MESTSGRRLRMRDWLYNLLERGDIPGIYWEDRSRMIFRVDWKHGSRHGYSFEKDAIVFKEWAEYTGKLKRCNGPDPKRLKANFRCALNSLKNIKRIEAKQDRGTDAFRRFQFVAIRGNNDDEGTRKIKQEDSRVKRSKTPIHATVSHQNVKIKEERVDSPVPKQSEGENEEKLSSGAICGGSFCYPLNQDLHFKWMTPPNSPDSLGIVAVKAELPAPRCNSCNMDVWGRGHSTFCCQANSIVMPCAPLTPPGQVYPDLDIESLSPLQADVYSKSIFDDFNNFAQFADGH